LRDKLSAADYALGRLDGAVLTLPNPDLFVFMYVRKEAVLSSQIEGTQSSLQNLLAAEAQLFDPDTPKDVNEVANYVRAMNHGLSRLADLPVSVRLIREIHAELMHGVRGGRLQPGELRVSQNWIGPAGCTLITAIFVPPPPHEVPQALSDLERFLHDGGGLPPLVQVGLAHAQFETIHPFLDGNGRIGRLLITFLLSEKRVLSKPVLYLSHYFKQRRSEYYERLQAVRDAGNWEGWLAFFLDGVIEVSQEGRAHRRGHPVHARGPPRPHHRGFGPRRCQRPARDGSAVRPSHRHRRHRARMAGHHPRRGQPDRLKAGRHRPLARDHRLRPQPAVSV